MNVKSIASLLCLLICAGFTVAESPNRHATSGPAGGKKDACKLLNSAEIQRVQGSRVEEATPSAQPSGGLQFSQCLFRTGDPVMSVSIALASPSTENPRDFWRKQFHARRESEEHEGASGKKAGREQEEEEGSQPRQIKGLGDEAYWIGSPIAGALYVLRATFFSASVSVESSRTRRAWKNPWCWRGPRSSDCKSASYLLT